MYIIDRLVQKENRLCDLLNDELYSIPRQIAKKLLQHRICNIIHHDIVVAKSITSAGSMRPHNVGMGMVFQGDLTTDAL